MSLIAELESLLFVAGRPISGGKLAELTNADKKETESALQELKKQCEASGGGIVLMQTGGKYELTTAPNCAKVVREFLKDEQTGEMTRPSLETLSIIAYRGPITKSELEMIRGVNCSLILRNLMIRGLVEMEENKEDKLNYYSATFDFMHFLGVSEMNELPDYEKLNKNKNLEELLSQEKTEIVANKSAAESETDLKQEF